MLLLDKNAEPHKTIFYISAVAYSIILEGNSDVDSIYQEIQIKIKDTLNYDFFILSLDFLFLLDKISINNKGEITVVY